MRPAANDQSHTNVTQILSDVESESIGQSKTKHEASAILLWNYSWLLNPVFQTWITKRWPCSGISSLSWIVAFERFLKIDFDRQLFPAYDSPTRTDVHSRPPAYARLPFNLTHPINSGLSVQSIKTVYDARVARI